MKNKKKLPKVDGDINININISNNSSSGEKGRKTRKRKTRKTKQTKKAPAKNRKSLPKSIDLQKLKHASSMCIATNYIHCEWSHEPMVKFRQLTKPAGRGKPKQYRNFIQFNDECWQKFGLNYGHKLAIFTDRLKSPRYVLFQNVVRHFECPAHIHKLGVYDVLKAGSKDPTIVRRTGKGTFLGQIGPKTYKSSPMQLFSMLPQLSNHTCKLFQAENNQNLFFLKVSDITEIPTAVTDKCLRTGSLVDDNLNVRKSGRFQMSLPSSVN